MINNSIFYKFLPALIICMLPSCSQDQESITGLYYADSKPIAITLKDGNISAVKRITTLPKESRDLTAEGVTKATTELWKTGVTTYIPTLTTNSYELLSKNFSVLAGVNDDPGLHGSIPGFRIEGPFISPVDGFRGAHPLRFVRPSDWDEFLELNKAAGNKIIQVTLAPEAEGAMDFISRCKSAGIIVGLGHHNGDTRTVTEAIDRSAVIATHLGNGCANTINRHNNPLWPQLSDDRMMQPATCNPPSLRLRWAKPATCNTQHATRNTQHATRNTQHATYNHIYRFLI